MTVNVAEAKANLSKLIDMACHGEKIVIAKNNHPMVDMVIHKPGGKRKLGLLSGKLTIPEDFCKGDEQVNEMFYGHGR
ncbi:MAG: type II toxin-antitoxin system Phd/YefM family antitoxin [Victivallales bacterium]|nr:type II toxin-antitoxin system Phd/YefM family antitoxin [Victivallales bacterium]